MTDLGTVAGTLNSQASFINSKTQIVGLSFACDFSVFNAILWESGSMVDLNTLIPPNSPFHLYSASFIDDRGVIAAFGSLANGDKHALLLIPCDGEHADIEGCGDGGEDAAAIQGTPAVLTQAPATAARLGTAPSGAMAAIRARMASRFRRLGLPQPQTK